VSVDPDHDLDETGRVADEHREAAARFPEDAVFHVGHGGPVGHSAWDWQRGYIETFVDAVSSGHWSEPERAKEAVVARMKAYEPSDELQVLMELSIEPVAAKLGLLSLPSSGRTVDPLERRQNALPAVANESVVVGEAPVV
jgi:hypothetical protein